MPLADNLVNVGTTAGDRTGDKGQVPFQKYNRAITELYGDVAALGQALNQGSSFIFTQMAPVSLWTIAHNLGRFPSVTVVDSTEREVEGDVHYLDGNTIAVSFSAPFSGVAYLN
jgi:hypothetical protein